MAKIDYYEYSKRDAKYARDMFSLKNYDPCGRFCQQSIEKRFKYYLELNGTADDIYIFSTHNLGKLYERICKLSKSGVNKSIKGDLSTLTDYYFDTNYPQEEGNTELTEEMAKEALDIMDVVNAWVDSFLTTNT